MSHLHGWRRCRHACTIRYSGPASVFRRPCSLAEGRGFQYDRSMDQDAGKSLQCICQSHSPEVRWHKASAAREYRNASAISGCSTRHHSVMEDQMARSFFTFGTDAMLLESPFGSNREISCIAFAQIRCLVGLGCSPRRV